MARINVEDCWWNDSRREHLGKLLGDIALAEGIVIRFWLMAQKYWKEDKRPIPIPVFFGLRCAAELLESNLARQETDGVYAVGSAFHFDWVLRLHRGRSNGGKSRSKMTRSANGQFDYSRDKTSTPPALTSTVPAPSSALTPTLTPKKKNEPAVRRESAPKADSSPHQLFIGQYVRSYQGRFGPETRPELSGKVQGQIRALLKDIPLDRACALVQAYLQMEDSWFATKFYDFATFASNLNKIAVTLDTGLQRGDTRPCAIRTKLRTLEDMKP